jgi:hypothetical protein
VYYWGDEIKEYEDSRDIGIIKDFKHEKCIPHFKPGNPKGNYQLIVQNME